MQRRDALRNALESVDVARLVVAGSAVLLLSGCATPTATPPAPAHGVDDAYVAEAQSEDCGATGIIEWIPEAGSETRTAALTEMIEGLASIVGTPDALLDRSPPEDKLLTLEAALRALPEAEARVEPGVPVVVAAVDGAGNDIGAVTIDPSGDRYVVSMFVIAHESGQPCPLER